MKLANTDLIEVNNIKKEIKYTYYSTLSLYYLLFITNKV